VRGQEPDRVVGRLSLHGDPLDAFAVETVVDDLAGALPDGDAVERVEQLVHVALRQHEELEIGVHDQGRVGRRPGRLVPQQTAPEPAEAHPHRLLFAERDVDEAEAEEIADQPVLGGAAELGQRRVGDRQRRAVRRGVVLIEVQEVAVARDQREAGAGPPPGLRVRCRSGGRGWRPARRRARQAGARGSGRDGAVMDPIHDFTAKLRQPSLAGSVERYVRWRRELARARAAGRKAPAPLEQAPVSLNLDLTTACNYRCDHCIDWEILNSRHRHREQALRASIATLIARGLRSVILIGGGEPTLYPGFAGFARFLKETGLGVAVVTNGSRGDRLLEIADALGERDWIRLSLDAGSDATFRAMHRPMREDLTLDEVCAWIPRIKERSPRVRIGYSYVIVWRGASRDGVPLCENIDEIAMAAERARRYGFDYISLKPILERGEDGAEVMAPDAASEERSVMIARIRAEVDRAKALETEDFTVRVSTNLRVLEEGSVAAGDVATRITAHPDGLAVDALVAIWLDRKASTQALARAVSNEALADAWREPLRDRLARMAARSPARGN